MMNKRAACAAAFVMALVAVTSASSRPAAGITVTAEPVVFALLQADRASGVHTYGVAAAARFTPDALHSEVSISIDDTRGAKQFVNVHDQGNQLHGSATYRGFFAVSGGTRHLVKAAWLAYTPEVSGRVEGRKTSPARILEVPLAEPAPRLRDQQKLQLSRDAKNRYVVCGSMMVAGGVAVATGVGAPLAVALGVIGGAVCTQAYLQDQMSRDPVDTNFRVVAKPKTPAIQKVAPGEGLSVAAAAAVNALVAVQAREIGLARAIYTAFNRSQGAHVKKQAVWERRQVLAAGKYAAELSALMLAELKLRSRVRALLRTVPSVAFEEAYVFGDSAARGSLPAQLTANLSKLGLSKADQKEVRAQLAVSDPGLYDGDAMATLTDRFHLASQREAAAALKEFAKRAAKDPLNTGN